MKIDYKLLREQKNWLLSNLGSSDDVHIEGLLSLIDYIQDEAVDNGESESVVFGVFDDK